MAACCGVSEVVRWGSGDEVAEMISSMVGCRRKW